MSGSNKKRKRSFFQQPAAWVAENLLGDYLVLKNGRGRLEGKIVETEAYVGVNDDASHSFGGKITPRNRIMYQAGGVIYIYLIYGRYWCFNIVTSPRHEPQAVFIRSLEPIEGLDVMKRNRRTNNLQQLTNGPGRWAQSFGIDKTFLGRNITGDAIFISPGASRNFSVVKTKRVGVAYAQRSQNWPLRFYIAGNPFVSKA